MSLAPRIADAVAHALTADVQSAVHYRTTAHGSTVLTREGSQEKEDTMTPTQREVKLTLLRDDAQRIIELCRRYEAAPDNLTELDGWRELLEMTEDVATELAERAEVFAGRVIALIDAEAT